MGSDCAKVQDGYGYCADCEQLGAFKDENARLDDELTQLREQLAETERDRDGWKKLFAEDHDALVDANQQLAKMRWALVSIRDMEPFRTAEQLAAIAEAALERKDA